MAINTEYGFIAGYAIFIAMVGVIVNLGAPTFLENTALPPALPSAPAVWDYLLYPIASFAYFFYLIGVTASAYPILGAVLIGYSFVFVYIVVGVLRGGH